MRGDVEQLREEVTNFKATYDFNDHWEVSHAAMVALKYHKGPNQKTTDMNPRRRFVASKSRRNCLGNLDKYEYTFTAFTYHIFYVVYPNQPAQLLRIIHTIRPSTISHTISISTLYLVLHCRLEQHFLHELHPPRETVSCHFSAPVVSAPFGETQTNRGNPKKVVLKSPNRAHNCQVNWYPLNEPPKSGVWFEVLLRHVWRVKKADTLNDWFC